MSSGRREHLVNNDTAAAAAAAAASPRLWELGLPAEVAQEAATSDFRRPWMLQVNDANDNNDKIPRSFDVIWFPDVMTGAGECEGLRFVGNTAADDRFPLMRAAVEQLIFPRELFNNSSLSLLRQHYEPLIEQVLQRQGGLTLKDVLGGDDIVEEFWTQPDTGPDLANPAEPALVIPWRSCRVERIV